MEDGTGLEKVIPSLVNSDYLKLNQKELPCLIRHGLEMPKDSMLFMPGNKKLTAFEISNIINYINTAWGNDEPVQNINAINAGLNTCL